MNNKRAWQFRAAGLISGLLMMFPHLYPIAAPVQLLALLPVLYLGTNKSARNRDILVAGFYMGIAYTLPQMYVVRLPVAMTVILLLHLTVLMMVFTLVSSKLMKSSLLGGAFAIGALIVLLDWVNFTVIPIWGTAQSFVRPWSRYPFLIQFVSLTGITGIIFALVTLQALGVKLIVFRKHQARVLAAMTIMVLVLASVNICIRSQQPTGRLKVAAVGWNSDDCQEYGELYTQKGFESLFAEPAAQAASQGAKLIVSPEMGFYFGNEKRDGWLEKFREVAQKHNVFLAIGYFNDKLQENRLLFMSPDGQDIAEYTKTYLTVFEDSVKGDGSLATVDIGQVRIGGMICQDDNFTRLSRAYGREEIGLVAVPSLDWRQVKNAHFQNSIHRAIESRYAIVRAACNGISAIISPMGDVIAQRDHFSQGPGFVVAEVDIYSNRTFFSIAGHWPVVLCFVFLIMYLSWNLVKSRSLKSLTGDRTKAIEKSSDGKSQEI